MVREEGSKRAVKHVRKKKRVQRRGSNIKRKRSVRENKDVAARGQMGPGTNKCLEEGHAF